MLYLAQDELIDTAYLDALTLSCRLAVISGCDSAHYDTMDVPDEYFGLTTAFMQAGAASVISSLWQVDDTATALLMVRFYELLLADDPLGERTPTAALRAARTWLRTLTYEGARTFVERHPELAALRLRASNLDATDRPFAHARYWAAFTAWGH